jgi:hypothetical protein
MAKDYTKYNVEGVGSNLSKARLVQAIVKDYIAKNTPNWEALQTAFPDSIQGGKGVVAKKDAGVKERDYYLNAPITLSDGTEIVNCRQWGTKNIADFLDLAKKLGYSVSANSGQAQADSNESELFSLSYDMYYSEDITENIEGILTSGDKERCEQFWKSAIDFVNSNNCCYWIIPLIQRCLMGFQGKCDDGSLDLYEEIDLMYPAGKELDVNPKKEYSLFYCWRSQTFKLDEDKDEEQEFFEILIKHFSDAQNIDDTGDDFYHTCITTLYCTICKMCQEDIAQDELVDLLLAVFNDQYLKDAEQGDFIWGVISETLTSLGVDLDEYKDESNLWRDMYLVNFDDVATYLIENDVFDHDYIPS